MTCFRTQESNMWPANSSWRDRARRSVLLSGIALGIPAAIYAAPDAWSKLQANGEIAGYQQQCMLHRRPAMQVVYDDDDAETSSPERIDPACGYIADRFSVDSRRFVALPADCWTSLMERTNPCDQRTRIPLFLHERSACELRRLVAVSLEDRRDDADSITLTLGCYRMEPATSLSPKALESSACRLKIPCNPAKTAVRFFAGEPDPTNPARFLIRYEINDAKGLLIGCLSPDDSVTLRVACGPGTLQ
jgi:hypothetical protein